MELLLGAILIFVALFIVFAAIGGLSPERSGVSRSLEVLEAMTGSPEELTKEADKPFTERVLNPLLDRLQRFGRRITGADQAERIRGQLDRAGNPKGWTVDRVSSGKILGTFVGAGLAAYVILLAGPPWPISVLIAAVCLVLGFYAPNIYLYNTAEKRNEQILKDLPDALDLLTISVEAGLGFDAALQQVARNTGGPLAGELTRALQEMQIGRSRSDALRGLGERSTVPDLKSFTSAMVQADAVGIPVAQVLRVQSNEMRTKRRQRAEEKAAQVPVKIMVPVILFILPCLMIVVMGPGILSMIEAFSDR
ncbi:type II secretion system F family protein [Nocardioides sp. AE5]|uniref:type II secretion system F family protein n=1 Tax=Nocardioides sp. AE5 TaxID=2962573 RepID=UPI002882017B|nr:type II secretion system F family protein [Nocardioides sp. AE5]MDT0201201.1 type II secretion system F family protein [Nocardioides sp. AE5]